MFRISSPSCLFYSWGVAVAGIVQRFWCIIKFLALVEDEESYGLSTKNQIAVPRLPMTEAEKLQVQAYGKLNLSNGFTHTDHKRNGVIPLQARCFIHGHSPAERLSATLSNAGTLSMHRRTQTGTSHSIHACSLVRGKEKMEHKGLIRRSEVTEWRKNGCLLWSHMLRPYSEKVL